MQKIDRFGATVVDKGAKMMIICANLMRNGLRMRKADIKCGVMLSSRALARLDNITPLSETQKGCFILKRQGSGGREGNTVDKDCLCNSKVQAYGFAVIRVMFWCHRCFVFSL